jgi:hypothetical protein
VIIGNLFSKILISSDWCWRIVPKNRRGSHTEIAPPPLKKCGRPRPLLIESATASAWRRRECELMSKALVDLLLWIPFGAALSCYLFRTKITRHVAGMLDKALSGKPSPPEWKRAKTYIANYRLGLFIAAAVAGAIAGAAIGSIGFALR